jgi:hypothetical protein
MVSNLNEKIFNLSQEKQQAILRRMDRSKFKDDVDNVSARKSNKDRKNTK